MKKLIFLTLITLVTLGCEDKKQPQRVYDLNNTKTWFDIYEIDSCEYLSGLSGAFTHKGNCKFCAERADRRKNELKNEIKELVMMLKEE